VWDSSVPISDSIRLLLQLLSFFSSLLYDVESDVVGHEVFMNINKRSTCRRNKQQLVHTRNWEAICCSNLQQVAKSWTCSSLGNKSPGPDFRRKKGSTCRQQPATCWTNLQLVAGNRQLVAGNKQLVEATGNKLLILSTCWTNWQLVASNKQQVAHTFNKLPATSNLSPVNKLLSTSRQCGQGLRHNIDKMIDLFVEGWTSELNYRNRPLNTGV